MADQLDQQTLSFGQSCSAGTRLGFREFGDEVPMAAVHPHPPHRRLHMTAADLPSLGSQKAFQHARAREGILQMQPVETSHDREIGIRHRARQVVDALRLS
jgi:hypothetical protein